MNTTDGARNVLVGIVVFIVVVLIILFLVRRSQNSSSVAVPVYSPLPTSLSLYRQQLQNNFGITVPSSATTADLKDVTGGNQMGLTTLDKSAGVNDYTVLANLNDPNAGYFYQAWLVRGTTGSSDFDVISLGTLSIAKGGWLIDYKSSKDLSDHKTVWITEERYATNTPAGKHILEGFF